MIVYKSGDRIKAPSAVMLGMFDGLHIGHKKLIEAAKDAAAEKNLKTVLYTFSSNPKADKVSVITNARKIQLCCEFNVDIIFFEDFTDDFKRKTPAEFIDYLKSELNAAVVVTGFDYRFGFKHEGTVSDLKNCGFDLIVVPEVTFGGEKVSSSAIRQYIENGEIAKANAMLGYPFSFCGTVLKGRNVGRKLGFRTANIEPPQGIVIPKDGVYASRTYVGGKCCNSVTNIGRNPTFNLNKTTIETHIFGFDGEVYGKKIEIEFVEFLRGEIKFSSKEELSAQIAHDVKAAKEILEADDVYKG